MKLLKNTARLFLALAVGAAPFAALSAEDKKMDASALMEPVKSILDHYLEIQSDLAKDSLKGVALASC